MTKYSKRERIVLAGELRKQRAASPYADSQSDAARAAGMVPSRLHKIEGAECEPTGVELAALVAIYCCSPIGQKGPRRLKAGPFNRNLRFGDAAQVAALCEANTGGVYCGECWIAFPELREETIGTRTCRNCGGQIASRRKAAGGGGATESQRQTDERGELIEQLCAVMGWEEAIAPHAIRYGALTTPQIRQLVTRLARLQAERRAMRRALRDGSHQPIANSQQGERQ